MENINQRTPFQVALHYATLLSLTSVVMSLVMFFFPESWTKSTLISILFSIIYFGILIGFLSSALNQYKREQGGFISFGQGMNIIAWLGLISSSISTVWSYIFYYYLNPAFFVNAKQMALAQLEAQDAPENMIEMQMKMLDVIYTPQVFLPTGFIFGFIFMIIIGLIVSAVVKKEKEHPF